MPATKNNFSHNTNFELEGVDTTTFTVDFINAMTAETSDLSSGSATAGLEAVRAVIGSYLNILAEGPLVESDKQKTYVVTKVERPRRVICCWPPMLRLPSVGLIFLLCV